MTFGDPTQSTTALAPRAFAADDAWRFLLIKAPDGTPVGGCDLQDVAGISFNARGDLCLISASGALLISLNNLQSTPKWREACNAVFDRWTRARLGILPIENLADKPPGPLVFGPGGDA